MPAVAAHCLLWLGDARSKPAADTKSAGPLTSARHVRPRSCVCAPRQRPGAVRAVSAIVEIVAPSRVAAPVLELGRHPHWGKPALALSVYRLRFLRKI